MTRTRGWYRKSYASILTRPGTSDPMSRTVALVVRPRHRGATHIRAPHRLQHLKCVHRLGHVMDPDDLRPALDRDQRGREAGR